MRLSGNFSTAALALLPGLGPCLRFWPLQQFLAFSCRAPGGGNPVAIMKLAQFGDQVVNAGDRFGWIGSALQLQQKSRGEAGSAEEGRRDP